MPRHRGHFGIARSVRLSVPRCSCLGYSHAGCLQLSHRRPIEMCGLRTSPRTDVDPPRFLPPSNCHRREGGYRLAAPAGRYLNCWKRVSEMHCCGFAESQLRFFRALISAVSTPNKYNTGLIDAIHSLFHTRVPLSATEVLLSQDRVCGTVYRLLL